MQEIQVSDDYLRQEIETAANITMKEPTILQVLWPDGAIVFLFPEWKHIGGVLELYLDTWDPQKQSEQDRIDEIHLAFEEARMQAEQLVEIV